MEAVLRAAEWAGNVSLAVGIGLVFFAGRQLASAPLPDVSRRHARQASESARDFGELLWQGALLFAAIWIGWMVMARFWRPRREATSGWLDED